MTTPNTPMTSAQAFVLAQQATFGPTESDVMAMVGQTPIQWLSQQFAAPVSSYAGQDRDQISRWDSVHGYNYCATLPDNTPERGSCPDQFISPNPIRRDFFKNASGKPDQLRQRVAFALSQIFVISVVDLPGAGTYGLADYQQRLLNNALGTYRDVMRSVTLHPLMGRYLNLSMSDKSAPNENYARELLQLFSLGVCLLNQDATPLNGSCTATYDNAVVREYAFALTGYMNPPGGTAPGETYGINPNYEKGEMVIKEDRRSTSARTLLSGVAIPAGATATQALNAVLDSIELHPNYAPFVCKQLIQFLVTSNPKPSYVQRVVTAFNAGTFLGFGSGVKGDLKAAVAAILLDDEARNPPNETAYGKIKEPTVAVLSMVRALQGFTDGEEMGVGWQSTGLALGQPFLSSPSVFNFYMPDYQIPGSNGVLAPQFQIITPNSILGWFNAVDDLVYGWFGGGSGLLPRPNIPGAVGTRLVYTSFSTDANSASMLVNRLNVLLTGSSLSAAQVSIITNQVNLITSSSPIPSGSSVAIERVKIAVFLIAITSAFLMQKRV